MDVFDRFIMGDTGAIEFNFDNRHFVERLAKYNISRSFIVDSVLYVEPLRYDFDGVNKYEVVFPAPSSKDYGEVRVIFACGGNRIDLLTIIPEGLTKRQKNRFASDEYKKVEKLKDKAYSRRKKLY
ncbi:MAG: hypothetical protein BZ136_00490 [Methanosphaera sp. rholeuAM74]|nr:MAG: hypothetical protein BZ136_00490 [Methanosphaera sp. rholeuAM74]